MRFPKLLGFGIVLIAFVSLSALIVPNLLSSRRSANSATAASSLRSIVGAQATYAATTGGERYGSLSQLGEAGLIDSVLSTGEKSGYRFRVELRDDRRAFDATAEPATAESGDRSFYINESGKLYSRPGQVAGTREAPGEPMGE